MSSGPVFVDVRDFNRVLDVLRGLEISQVVTINGRTWRRIDGRFLVDSDGTLFDVVEAAKLSVQISET